MSESLTLGGLLSQTLTLLEMSQATFARRTGLSPKHVNQICQGHANVSARSAVRFEEVTDVGAEVWLRLQARRDIAAVREARAAEIADEQARRASAAHAVAELVEEIR